MGSWGNGGRRLRIRGRRESRSELLSWLNGCTYVLPTILTALFGEPVVVRRICGTVADEPLRWTFHRGAWIRCEVTAQGAQEDKFLRARNLSQVVSRPESKRLTAALQYFEVVCRLARVGATAWEFGSEV